MSNNLEWIACNGVEPDLPDNRIVSIIFEFGNNPVIRNPSIPAGNVCWGNVICYALEPVDPVQALVDVAKELNEYPHRGDRWARIDAVIKAVEEML